MSETEKHWLDLLIDRAREGPEPAPPPPAVAPRGPLAGWLDTIREFLDGPKAKGGES